MCVKIPEDRTAELVELTDSIHMSNIVSARSPKTYTGKTNSLALLVDLMRTFISVLYGTIKGIDDPSKATNAPEGCAWSTQVRTSTTWIKAFLLQQKGGLKRNFTLHAFLNQGVPVEFFLGAPPWGI